MDQTAFCSAAERYQNTVYRLALQYFGNSCDAEDAVQEVFLRLYTEQKPFAGEEHLRRWLLRVTVNYCRDVLKSPWRRRRAYPETLPEQAVFDQTEQTELYTAVMALPEKYRTVVHLFYYEELSTGEIAQLLRLRQTAVTTRLHRARELLKQRLGENWHEE